MTLPTEEIRVRAIKLGKGYDYKVGPKCSRPGCARNADHAHHIASRAALGGPYTWIEIDGKVVGNLTGLCFGCHDLIHAGKTAIKWIKDEFWWCQMSGSKAAGNQLVWPLDPLTYQPPTPDSLVEQTSGPVVESDHCPMCGQIKRRRRTGPRRRRKTWIVKVPDEAEEDGAEILDTLVANLALIIPNADAGLAGRYYVIVHSLAYSTMHSQNFAETLTGRSA